MSSSIDVTAVCKELPRPATGLGACNGGAEGVFGLDKEQQYLFTIAEKLRIPLTVIQHNTPTSTCQEKAAILGWALERMIKTIFFAHRDHVVGVVLPEIGQVNQKHLFKTALGITSKQAKRYICSGFTPTGMERGTCTPFVRESSMGKEVHKLIVVNCPGIDQEFVDVSVGGVGVDAHKVSLHIPYSGIYAILRHRFNEDVVQASLDSTTDDGAAAVLALTTEC